MTRAETLDRAHALIGEALSLLVEADAHTAALAVQRARDAVSAAWDVELTGPPTPVAREPRERRPVRIVCRLPVDRRG